MAATARVNSDAPERSICRPAETAEGQRNLTRLVFATADALKLQEKELAFALGYDPAYLSRIKKGEKPLPVDRLTRLSKDFRRVLWTMAATEDGLVVASEDAKAACIGRLLVALGEAMALLDDGRKRRMAKAGL